MNTLLAHSSNYTKGRVSDIKYIVIHYTANDGDKAISNCNYFQSQGRNASAHYFVDENEVWQSVLDGDTAWHCGTSYGYKHSYCRNNNSIGIELCSRKNSNGTYYILQEVVDNAVELTKELMDLYNIPVDNIVRHYDVTGKICPAPFVENEDLFQSFKNDLLKKEDEKSSISEEEVYMKISRVYEYKDNKMEFEVINQDGYNYVKVRDLAELLGKTVSYENDTKLTTLAD